MHDIFILPVIVEHCIHCNYPSKYCGTSTPITKFHPIPCFPGVSITSSSYDADYQGAVSDNKKYMEATNFINLECITDMVVSNITQCPQSISTPSPVSPGEYNCPPRLHLAGMEPCVMVVSYGCIS